MICTEEDHWLKEKLIFEARWVCHLNDGTSVYMDDERHLVKPASAWLRLKEYCRTQNCHIVAMKLQWRQLVAELPPNKDAYFFCKEILGIYPSEINIDYFVVGYVENDILHTMKYEVPSLTFIKSDDRIITVEDRKSDCFIWAK